MLPTEAYLQITGMFDLKGGADPVAAAAGAGRAGVLAQERLVAGRSYVTVTGKAGAGARTIGVVAAGAAAAGDFACWSSALIVYFYLLLFYASIVLAFGANHTLTLDHYRVIFSEGLPAIRDTLIIAADRHAARRHLRHRGRLSASDERHFIGRKAMEMVSMLNYALPGTIVGIAYLLAFNDEPIALTGTAAIIIACYVFRYSPIGIRTTVALLQQIDKSMEEASASLGAGSCHDVPPHHAAADPAGVLRRPRRRLHPLDDGDQRHDLSGLDQLDADHREDPREHDRGGAWPGGGFFGVRDRRRACW